MKKRSVVAVLLLSFITIGIYSLYWQVKTKGELNAKGASIPTAWLIIVPIVNIWWLWKYSEGVEKVTGGQPDTVISFILLFLLGFIGQAIIQNFYNNLESAPAPATLGTESAPAPAPAPETPDVQPPTTKIQ